MNHSDFWNLVERCHARRNKCAELSDALASGPDGQIVAFHQQLLDLLNQAFRWDLWAVAYIVNGGCGSELFEYFRSWLIYQGQDYFETALESPLRAADQIQPGGGLVFCPELLEAAPRAYKTKLGEDLPIEASEASDEPAGTPWLKEDLEVLYPELWYRFGWSEGDSGADHPRSRAYQRRQQEPQ